MEDGSAADRSNVWRHGPIICDCDMDHFSILEIIGASAIALLGMAVSKPTVIAVLEWLGYRIYTVDEQHTHDLLVGVGATVSAS